MVKLISAHIHRFGMLHDIDVRFDSGMNINVGNNSTGKSTLAMFIKAMLYGLEYRKVYNIDKDSKLYQPWNSTELFGGSLVYAKGDKEYKIERMMGATATKEQVSHIELDTGKNMSTEDIGEQLFGINSESYDKTLFCPQADIVVSNNETFAHKLSSMVDGGNNNNYEQAISILDKASKEYKHKTGSGGLINTLTREIHALDQQLHDKAQDRATAVRLENETAILQLQLDKAEQDKEQLVAKIDQLTADKATNTLSQSQLDDITRLSQAELYLATNQHHSNIEQDIAMCNEILNQPQRQPRAKVACYIITAIVLTLLLAVTLAMYPTVGIVIWIAYGVIVAVAVLLVVIMSTKGRVHGDNGLQGIISKYMYYDHNDQELMKQMYQLMNQYQQCVATVNQLQGKVANQVDNSQLDQQIESCKSSVRALEDNIKLTLLTIATNNSRIKTINDNDNSSSLMDDRLDKASQLDIAQYRYDTLQKCINAIKIAKTNMSSAYVPHLTSRCQQLMSTITQGLFDSITMDETLAINITSQGVARSIEYYSRGTKELAIFCLRIALSEALFDNALPLLIIDDAFVNLDDVKFQAVMKMLSDMSLTTQIIYFSCHKRSK